MKKITTLLFASIVCGMLCFSVTHAQEKVWGVSSIGNPPNSLFHMNTDGTDRTEALQANYQGGILGVTPQQVIQGADNSIYVINGSGGSDEAYGTIIKITPNGIFRIHQFYYAETSRMRMVDGQDGYLYSVGCSVGCFGTQIMKVSYDGDDVQKKRIDLNASSPRTSIIRTSNGELFSTCGGEGSAKRGAIYKIHKDLSGITIVYSFSGPDGKSPGSTLIEGKDGFLYGTTDTGGANNLGVVYKVRPNGSEFSILHNYRGGVDGRAGRSLVQDSSGYIYGVTGSLNNDAPWGGRYKKGYVFRMKPDGSQYTSIFDFDGVEVKNVIGDISMDTDGYLRFFYGMNSYLKIKKDGAEVVKIVELYPYTVILGTTNNLAPANTLIITPVAQNNLPISGIFSIRKIENAIRYTVELSATEDFSALSFSGISEDTTVEYSGLSYSKKYYARVKTNAWPEYGPTTSFTTEAYPYVYAPKLWGIQDNAVVYMNLDGSEYEQSFQVDPHDLYPFWLGEFPHSISLINEAIFGINKFNNQYEEGGTLFKLKADGVQLILDDSNLNDAHIADGGNGYIYGVNRCDEQCSLPYIFKLNVDGSDYTTRNLSLYAFNPVGGLITTHDHKVIGLSSGGGANNKGFMYSVRADLSGIEILYSFSGPDGKGATTKLLEGHDGKLYGITTTGGLYNYGAVFSIQSDGQGYTKLHDFTKIRKNGSNPIGNLVQDYNNTLYGICQLSGAHKKGMIFKINPNGSGYSIIYNFDGALASNPSGNLLIEDDYLYGSASGKFFRVKTDGTNFTILHNGTFLGNTLSFINKTPIKQETHILPEVPNPGYSFFSVPINPKPFSVQYTLEISKYPDFSEIAFTGSNSHPFSSVPFVEIPVTNLEHATTYYARARSSHFPYFGPVSTFTTLPQAKRLFGLARAGGLSGCDGGSLGGGAVYSIELDGSNFIKHRDYPCGGILEHGLIQGDDRAMYGTISYATSSGGNIFRIDLSGNFSYLSNNYFSTGDFMQASTGNFYLTEPEHPFDHPDPEYSTLQFVEPNPPAVAESSVLFTFDDTQGNYVNGAPIEREDGYLYGLAAMGGLNQDGILYKIGLDGEDFQVLYHFTQSTGANPYGSLMEDEEHALYGTTSSGGLSNKGTIFRIQPDGTDYQVIYHFQLQSGMAPGKVLLIGDSLYGVTSKVIFKLHKNGTGYTTLHQFEYDEVLGGLRNLISDGQGYLYGVRPGDGGSHNFGFIFKIKMNGAEYSVLHTFTNYTGGWGLRDLLLVDPEQLTQSKKFAQKSSARQGGIDSSVNKKASLVTLSPNPFDNSFAIQVINKDVPSHIIISDVNGRVLYEGQLSMTRTNELGESLSAGLYIVRVIQGNKTSVYRVVKK